MNRLEIFNPFMAPVYHEETVTSTIDISRCLASEGMPHGTVIVADYQEAGRGRGRSRLWEMESTKSLSFTILLRYPSMEKIPTAFTLRAGLASAYAIEDFSSLQNVMIKWPNDIMIGAKKTAGILCEADGGNVHLGIGINMAQTDFPAHLREKATSLALAIEKDIPAEDRFVLLEKTLNRLFDELENGKDWNLRLKQKLYGKDKQVVFIEGFAASCSAASCSAACCTATSCSSTTCSDDSGTGDDEVSHNKIVGKLAGIGAGGELLILPDGEKTVREFTVGELII